MRAASSSSDEEEGRRERRSEMGAEGARRMRRRAWEVAKYLAQVLAAQRARPMPRTAPSKEVAARAIAAAVSLSRDDMAPARVGAGRRGRGGEDDTRSLWALGYVK